VYKVLCGGGPPPPPPHNKNDPVIISHCSIDPSQAYQLIAAGGGGRGGRIFSLGSLN
jgi:hypothetical protein